MSSFKDKQGRDWTVVIDGYVLSRARSHGGLSLSTILPKQTADGPVTVSPDPAFLIELCYYGCEHHARIAAGKVSKEDFLRMMTGKVMSDAMTATAAALTACLAPPEGETDEVPLGENPAN